MEPTKELDLYKMAIDEYRFEVNLSWESVKFFTTLNIGILGFGLTLLGLEQLSPKWIVAPIFVIGILLSILSIVTRVQYRKYYLETILIKKKLENVLNLSDLAISPTEFVDQPSKGLYNKEAWMKKHTRSIKTVTFCHYLVLSSFIVAHLFGIYVSLFFI